MDEDVDEDALDRRMFSVEEKLVSERFAEDIDNLVHFMDSKGTNEAKAFMQSYAQDMNSISDLNENCASHGTDFTLQYVQENGLRSPIIFRERTELGMTYVDCVAQLVCWVFCLAFSFFGRVPLSAFVVQ